MAAGSDDVVSKRNAVGQALPHDSAHLHVSGRAAYTDDIPEPRDLLHVAVGMSSEAHARRFLPLTWSSMRAKRYLPLRRGP